MKNIEMAADYAFRAERCLREAELALAEHDFPGTVRRSQEALELAVKAVLRYLAIEYPREHDVGEALTQVIGKLPSHLKERIPATQALLTELTRVRGPAFYGYEREGIPARKAFSRKYAEDVFHKVGEIVKLCVKYVEET